jgi:hypothetical protein
MNKTIQEWAVRLYDAGLIALPCWGGGKALPGTHHRMLADNPPSRLDVANANYSGGLSIILGTYHPGGGFITAFDVDDGPNMFSNWPEGLLLAEEGTATGKWHLFLTTIDRLNGQINLRNGAGNLVAKIKGYGLSLRSWPTIPSGKPRGYHVVELVDDRYVTPSFTVSDTTIWLRELLSSTLKRDIHVENSQKKINTYHPMTQFPGLARKVETELVRRGIHLSPCEKDGWQSGQCPFHDDTHPSFSVSFQQGAWKCWSGCGSGSLSGLAWRLGLRRDGHPRIKETISNSWEVKG